ncbi:MAG: hypothetical protein WBR26_18770 [Candidatus Acidiferrum sp.]
MFTIKEWHEFLYECGLIGQQWLHADRVGMAYLYWRTGETDDPFKQEKVQAMLDAFRADPAAGEETLLKFLSEPQWVGEGATRTIPEETKQRIVKMLHFILNEEPNLGEWVN